MLLLKLRIDTVGRGWGNRRLQTQTLAVYHLPKTSRHLDQNVNAKATLARPTKKFLEDLRMNPFFKLTCVLLSKCMRNLKLFGVNRNHCRTRKTH